MTPSNAPGSRLPLWARVADALTLALAAAAAYVTAFGGVRVGDVFSMSTPWRALGGLTVICALRHYFVRTRPLHRRWLHARPWAGLVAAGLRLAALPARCWHSHGMRLAWLYISQSPEIYKRVTRMSAARALQLCALTALAVAQPLFDVVSREPTFFVARNTTGSQLVAFVVLIVGGLPLALIAVEAVAMRLHARVGNFTHVVLLTILGSMLLLPLLKRIDNMDTASMIAVSLVLGAGVAFGCQRSAVIRTFLTALSPATLVVPVLFLANADIRAALVGVDDSHQPVQVDYAPPIVFVVFDEFPTVSLLNAEREIDANRYPNFARLAADATWYRNASTVSSQTLWAVPAMVTGKYPVTPHAVPTRRYYPDNLFTMLSGSYQMTVFGRFLQLCPSGSCTYDLEVHDTLWTLTADLAVVFLHIIAPDSMAARLPPIVGDWQGFAQLRMFREVEGEQRRNDRSSEYGRFLRTIGSQPAGQLYFLHTLTPHMPFEYMPSGRRYVAPDYQSHMEGGSRLFINSDPWFPVVLQQRHLLQVGFADRFIGELIDRLKDQGIYEQALVVVTADHGSSFLDGQPRRTARDGNRADILQVPLIVKFPEQEAPTVNDANVETVDILPTITDVLSITTPFEVDGRSLVDGPIPDKPYKTFIRRNAERVNVDRHEVLGGVIADHSLRQKLDRFESSLYSLGPHGSLVGRSVTTLGVEPATTEVVTLDDAARFENIDLESTTLPLYVRGAVRGDATERVSIAIGMNGVVVATTLSYLERDRWVFATVIPQESLRSGPNNVQVFVLGSVDEDAVLVSSSDRHDENNRRGHGAGLLITCRLASRSWRRA